MCMYVQEEEEKNLGRKVHDSRAIASVLLGPEFPFGRPGGSSSNSSRQAREAQAAATHFPRFQFRGFSSQVRAGVLHLPTRLLASDRHLGRNAGAGKANHRHLPFLG